MNNQALVCEKSVVIRTGSAPTFYAYSFISWAHALSVLEIYDYESSALITDLSLGAWTGHWIARELMLQLELDLNIDVQPLLNKGDYADIVTKLIDNESTGDKNFVVALESCQLIKSRILEKNIKYIIVIPPGYNNKWEDENLLMMKLLYDAFRETNIRIVLFCYPQSNIPPTWKLNYLNELHIELLAPHIIPFYPGILTQKKAIKLGLTKDDLAFLRQGYVAIQPLLARTTTIDLNSFQDIYDKSYLRASCYSILPDVVGRDEVNKEAFKRFAEGGYGIAIRLLSALILNTKSLYERSILISQIQNIRIALLRFDDAATESIPDETLPSIVKASLYQSKAWGLVMCNKALEAEPFFEQARLNLDPNHFPRLYLYLLNISALNKMRIGNTYDAFVYEKQIEHALGQQINRDWHITYINNINQARLFKREKNYKHAKIYYDKAFSVITQLKNESDLLYSNFCYAQLEELKGNSTSAFLFFLRACIHWLSNDMPEALAPRVAQAILNKRLQFSRVDVDEISNQLKQNLQYHAHRLNLLSQFNQPISPLIFTRPQKINSSLDRIVGQPGWAVCLSHQIFPPVYSGYRYDELRVLVTKVIQVFFPSVNLSTYNTVIADTQFSCELPANLTEMMLLALRQNIFKLNWCDKVVDLTEQDMKALRFRAKVQISPAVDFVTYHNARIKVHYKRYRLPLLLSLEETKAIEYLNDVESCQLQKFAAICDFDELQEKRVIQIFYE